MNFTMRTFLPGDDEKLVHIWNRTLTRDPITTKLFQRQTLATPTSTPPACLSAETPAHETLGFVLLLAPRVAALHSASPGSGRIVAIGVDSASRRQGIGSALLNASLD